MTTRAAAEQTVRKTIQTFLTNAAAALRAAPASTFLDDPHTTSIQNLLADINEAGMWTTNSQIGIIADRGRLRQRAYLTGFVTSREQALALDRLGKEREYVVLVSRVMNPEESRHSGIECQLLSNHATIPVTTTESFGLQNTQVPAGQYTAQRKHGGLDIQAVEWHPITTTHMGSVELPSLAYEFAHLMDSTLWSNPVNRDFLVNDVCPRAYSVRMFDPIWGRDRQLFDDVLRTLCPPPGAPEPDPKRRRWA